MVQAHAGSEDGAAVRELRHRLGRYAAYGRGAADDHRASAVGDGGPAGFTRFGMKARPLSRRAMGTDHGAFRETANGRWGQ